MVPFKRPRKSPHIENVQYVSLYNLSICQTQSGMWEARLFPP